MRPNSSRNIWDEDVAKREWAREQDRKEVAREKEYSKNRKEALSLTQSELAKRPDLWHAMPVYNRE